MSGRRSDRVPPNDLAAEESVLGAMLLSSEARTVAFKALRAEDFYRPANAHIFMAIGQLHQHGQGVDPVTVADLLRGDGLLELVGGPTALFSIMVNTPATSNASRYAQIIQEKATLRNLLTAAGETAEDVYSGIEVDTAVRNAQDRMGAVVMPSGTVAPGPNVDEFLGEIDTWDWVVPALMERGDRLILTGGEGRGKSTLLRQFALQAAAGIRPFTDSNGNSPVRVMLVDCENSAAQTRRALRPLRLRAGMHLDPDFLSVLVRPQGLDLLGRPDRKWLTERIDANVPDVVVMGPMYRLHNDDPNEERPARALAAFLDDLRVRYGFALVLETHQPHASGGSKRVLRPFGASLWTRWPEFGLGLLQDTNDPEIWRMSQWRGSRDDRDWPHRLTRGGPWPWNEVRPTLGGIVESNEEVF